MIQDNYKNSESLWRSLQWSKELSLLIIMNGRKYSN